MNTIEFAIVNIGIIFILIYRFNYIYWVRYLFVRPFMLIGVKEKYDENSSPSLNGRRYSAEYKERMQRWAGYSMRPLKPFTCLSCMVLWTSFIESILLSPEFKLTNGLTESFLYRDPISALAFILGAYVLSAIIQKIYES